MPRPKSKDPALHLHATVPGSILKRVVRAAKSKHTTLSAYVSSALREYFEREKGK
jgi:hypothetical protein